MDNNLDYQMNLSEEETEIKKFPFWKIISRNIWLILVITILVGSLGLGLGVLKSQTIYTAQCNVLLSVSISKNPESTDAKYDISLAKLYLPTLTSVMKSSIVETRANEIYKQNGHSGRVSVSAVTINYSEDGLIFSMSYSDIDEKACENKLAAFIQASTDELEKNGSKYFHAQQFLLTPTKNDFVKSQSNNMFKYVLLGLVGGVGVSLVVVMLIYLLDNKVKTGSELEELTGVSLLAYIDKDEE